MARCILKKRLMTMLILLSLISQATLYIRMLLILVQIWAMLAMNTPLSLVPQAMLYVHMLFILRQVVTVSSLEVHLLTSLISQVKLCIQVRSMSFKVRSMFLKKRLVTMLIMLSMIVQATLHTRMLLILVQILEMLFLRVMISLATSCIWVRISQARVVLMHRQVALYIPKKRLMTMFILLSWISQATLYIRFLLILVQILAMLAMPTPLSLVPQAMLYGHMLFTLRQVVSVLSLGVRMLTPLISQVRLYI